LLYSLFDNFATPDLLQSCLCAISERSDHWQYYHSPSNCVVDVRPSGSHRNSDKYIYKIGSVELPCVESVTDLGVTYCNRLKFSLHIDAIVTKACYGSN